MIDDSLLVRIYDNAGVLASELASALRTTHDILRRADLIVDWVQCRARRDGPVPAVCDQPLSSGDVVVRLIEGSDKESGERRALGYSLFDANGVSGFATVYVDRVDWLAKRAQYPRAPLLGRAIAHEIGHLLLRSNAHTETRIDAGGMDRRASRAKSPRRLDVLRRIRAAISEMHGLPRRAMRRKSGDPARSRHLRKSSLPD